MKAFTGHGQHSAELLRKAFQGLDAPVREIPHPPVDALARDHPALARAHATTQRHDSAEFRGVGALGLSLLLSLLFAGWLMQKLIERQARREEQS